MKVKIITFLLLTASVFLFSKTTNACVNPDTIVTVVVNYDTVTNAPFITDVEIRLTNLRLMNENNNKICSCALSQWAELFKNIDYVAFVDSGTNNPYAGFAAWNATVGASSAWNNSQPGYSWSGLIADVINAGLSANDPVDLVIRATTAMGLSYTLIGDSVLGYNSLIDEIDQGALGTDEWSAANNDLVSSHQSVVGFASYYPGNSVSYAVKLPAYFTKLDNDILNNIPVGVNDYLGNNIFSVEEYPNPVKSQLTIQVNLNEKSHVSVVIYGITGEKISVVANAKYETGSHNIIYNTEDDLDEGVYFIEYLIGNERKVSKLIKY